MNLQTISLLGLLLAPRVHENHDVIRGGRFRVVAENGDTTVLLRSNGHTIFRASSFGLTPGEFDEECEASVNTHVLSLVGNLLSYVEFTGWDCPGAAHPSGRGRLRTIALSSVPSACHLTDMFTASQIASALRESPFIQRAVPGVVNLSSTTSLSSLLEFLEAESHYCAFALTPDLLDSFAFQSVTGTSTVIRIGLRHGCEASRGSLTEFAITLPTPRSLARALRRADLRSQGILGKDTLPIEEPQEGAFSP